MVKGKPFSQLTFAMVDFSQRDLAYRTNLTQQSLTELDRCDTLDPEMLF